MCQYSYPMGYSLCGRAQFAREEEELFLGTLTVYQGQ